MFCIFSPIISCSSILPTALKGIKNRFEIQSFFLLCCLKEKSFLHRGYPKFILDNDNAQETFFYS